MERGQVSVEYLILIGFITFAILTIAGVVLFYSTSIQDQLRFNQLERLSQKVIGSADTVFYSGLPAKATITIYVPAGIEALEVTGTLLVFNVSSSHGTARIAYTATVPLEGSFNISSGVKRIEVTAKASSVLLREA